MRDQGYRKQFAAIRAVFLGLAFMLYIQEFILYIQRTYNHCQKSLEHPFDCSILCDNYEIPVKNNRLRPATPQNNVELTVGLADSCVKAI